MIPISPSIRIHTPKPNPLEDFNSNIFQLPTVGTVGLSNAETQ
jgi:hypothetical protein